MGDLGRFLGQGFVVEFTRLVGIEAEVELVVPAERAQNEPGSIS